MSKAESTIPVWGLIKEHCNSELVSDLDVSHFYNDFKISNLSGAHFWIHLFYTVQNMLVLQKVGL